MENDITEKALDAWSNKRYKKAIKYFDAVIQENPWNPEYYFFRAECKEKSRDYSGAISDLKYFFSNQEYSIEAMENLAGLLIKIGNNQEAKELLNLLMKYFKEESCYA